MARQLHTQAKILMQFENRINLFKIQIPHDMNEVVIRLEVKVVYQVIVRVDIAG